MRYRILRTVTFLVIFFFTWTMGGLFNVAYAAYHEIQKPESNKKQSQRPEAKFQKAMDDLKDIVSRKYSLETKRSKIREKRDAIESLDKEIKSQFADTENKLKNAGLPQEILQRHYNFVKHYEDNLKELRTNLNAANQAKTDTEFETHAQKIRQHLEKTSFRKSHKPLDPNKLPHRLSDIKRKEPRTTPEEFQKDLKQRVQLPRPLWEGIEGRGEKSVLVEHLENAAIPTAVIPQLDRGIQFAAVIPAKAGIQENLNHVVTPAQAGVQNTINKNNPLLLAANGPLSGLVEKLPKYEEPQTLSEPIILALAHDAPTAADLDEAIDVRLTPAIKAKAAELNYSPVKIYNWVRNNVEYVPTYGSIQGADMCLQTLQGNDFDIASLLIALLRASGIHARYVYGTIELPIDKVMNWVGGFTDANAAVNFIASGGTPVSGLISGGKISVVRMEHVWVEAYVKYYPLRGAKHITGQGDSWIPLDASYKQYNYTQGIDIKSAVPFDAQSFVNQIQSTATIDTANSSVTGVDCKPLSQMMSVYKENLKSYLDQKYSNATIGEVIGNKEIKKQEFSYLPGTLPYTNVVTGTRYSEIPDNLRYKIQIKLKKDLATDIILQKNLPELAGNKITIGYIPATSDDAVVINAYLPQTHSDGTLVNYNELPQSLPAYLINLKPELRINNNVFASGASIGMGMEQSIDATLSGPNRSDDNLQVIINAGEYTAIVVDTGKMAESQMRTVSDKLNATVAKLESNSTEITREDVVGDILHGTGISYFAEIDKSGAVKAKMMDVIHARLPSVALVSSGINLSYVFDAPQNASSGGFSVNLLSKMYMAEAVDGNKDRKLKHAFVSGLDSSALAGIVQDKIVSSAGSQALSAIKVLEAAKSNGIPVYTIDSTNINNILTQLQIDANIIKTIQNAVNAGKIAIVPKANVTLNGWTGTAYIITDKTTGDGAYNISGEINGGVLRSLPWMNYSIINNAIADFGTPLVNLSRMLINQNAVASIRNIEQGIANLAQSLCPLFMDALISGVVYNEIASELGCYINTSKTGTSLCSSIYLGSVCVAMETTPLETVNNRPVAIAGSDATVAVGTVVIADGSASYDADGDPLSFQWTLISKPQGSTARLSSNVSVSPSLATDQPGLYKLQLIVCDGKSYSDSATISLTAADKIVTVPDLVGRDQTSAEVLLAQTGLTIGATMPAASETVAAGLVISQTPVAGTMVYKESAVSLVVSSGVKAVQKPVLSLSFDRTPPVYAAGEQVKAAISVQGTSNDVSVTMKVDGTSVSVVMPVTSIDTTGMSVGSSHKVVVTAMNSSGGTSSVELSFGISDPAAVPLPDVAIIMPAKNAEITKLANIIGNITTPNLMEYTLAYSPVGKNQYTVFSRGTSPMANNVIGSLDPTMMKNGIYDILLKAVDTSGNIKTAATTYRVSGEMKVGNFTVAFTDVNVSVTGIPVTVTRMYDSREKSSRDFGYGWTIDIKNINIQENIIPGTSWTQPSQGGSLPTYCVEGDNAEHYVIINLPDGTTNEFDLTFNPQCQQLQPVDYTQAVYNARPGTTSKLQARGVGDLYYNAGRVLDMNTGDYYNPVGYILTTAEGMVYDLDKSFGIRTITDPNGNKITYSQNGISHSSGKSVQIARDAQNRITQITDPNGGTVKYAYDESGDLVAVTDQNGNTSHYTYNSVHGLIDIKDPRGVNAVKNIYEDSGRLTAHIDAYGNKIEYTHDIAGRQEIVKDRNGNITVFIYDEKGRVLSKTDVLGNTTSYTYDAIGNKLTETDPLGNTTTNTYDAKKNKLSETRVVNGQTATTSYTYNEKGKVLTIADAMGHVTTNTYDTAGNLLAATDALGKVTTSTYDTRGNILTTTDPLGNVTRYTYDDSGNRTKQTDARGNITTYTYDQNGNKLAETDARGNTTGYTYDAKGNVLAVTDAQGNVTRTQYDKAGNKVAQTDALGVKTTFVYNAANKLIQTNYPDGTSTAVAYDNEGNRTITTDALNRTTTYQYDVNKNLTKVTYPDNTSIAYGYDKAGHQTTIVDASGNITTREYDSLNRVTKTIDPEGNATTFAYDLNGNQSSTTDANGHITTFEYDAKGQQTKVILQGGQTTTTVYDAIGRKESVTDAAGNVTQYAYDQNGNLIKVTDAENNVTQFEYDANNNKTAVIDANGHTTSLAYDQFNRLISKTMPNGGTETYTYDPSGKQTAKIDAINNTIQYTYDARGRLYSRSYPDGSITKFSYNANGNRVSATDKRGQTSYAYDARNRLTNHAYPDGQTIDYTYDDNGRLKTIATQVGTITYDYTSCCGRLQSVTDPGGKTTNYSYDPAGNRTGLIYPNGTNVTYTYDANNRLTNLTHKNATQTIASYAYTPGATGNRTRVDEATGISRVYNYDKLYRLTKEQVTDPNNTQTYTNDYVYDAIGNRQSKTGSTTNNYTYNNADQLLTENGIAYTYDLNGNLKTKTDGTGTTTYTYNYDQKLISVATPSGAATYKYDADGNRVEANTAGSTTKYLVDTNRSLAQVVAEYNTAGTITASYVYADDLISMTRGSQTYYYHFDGLGSTRLLTNASGTTTDKYDYDAFGNLIAKTGSTENTFLFTGQQYDANIGFYYQRARYYQPTTGRFTAYDPIEGDPYTPISLHKYLYAANDPVNKIDPSGEMTLAEVTAVSTIINTLYIVLPMIPSSFLKSEVRLCKRNFETLGAAFGMFARFGGSAKLHHEFIGIKQASVLNTYGFAAEPWHPSLKCISEGPGHIDVNNRIDRGVFYGTGGYAGSCATINCNAKTLQQGIDSERSKKKYYDYCLLPSVNDINGINCQQWAKMIIGKYCH